jgi:hypothetical protein
MYAIKIVTDMSPHTKGPNNVRPTKQQKRNKREQRLRRSQTLLKKAFEISYFDGEADIFVGIRFRDTGRVKTFCADQTGIWSAHCTHLVCAYLPPITRLR